MSLLRGAETNKTYKEKLNKRKAVSLNMSRKAAFRARNRIATYKSKQYGYYESTEGEIKCQ